MTVWWADGGFGVKGRGRGVQGRMVADFVENKGSVYSEHIKMKEECWGVYRRLIMKELKLGERYTILFR